MKDTSYGFGRSYQADSTHKLADPYPSAPENQTKQNKATLINYINNNDPAVQGCFYLKLLSDNRSRKSCHEFQF